MRSQEARHAVVPLLELHSCILHKANYRGLVLVGVEEFRDGKTRTEYPQAWWLRIAAPPVAMSPADEDDEVEDIYHALALA